MIAPIFIRSETLSLKRNSKKTASVIFGKNVACNYCIEKTSRVILHLKNVACNYCIIPEKNVACNSDEKNGECNFEGKKTTSVMVKKTASVYHWCLQSWPFSAIVMQALENSWKDSCDELDV